MSENANQTTPHNGSENSGQSGRYEQGGRRNNPSGNRNNRRRRPSQPYGTEPSSNQVQREPVHFGPSGQPGGTSGRPQNAGIHQDQNQPKRNNNQPQRPNQGSAAHPAGSNTISVNHHAGPGYAQGNQPPNMNRSTERTDPSAVRQGAGNRPDRMDNQSSPRKQNNPNVAINNERPREARTWGKHVRSEETYEDVRKENERLEKEIWLEIASIHTSKID